MKSNLVFRYAPTPSGFLHAGNLMNFTLTYLLARALEAKILLRIDDLDSNRKRPEYLQHIFDCLNNFGLTYEHGPRDIPDFEQNWRQELRNPLYQDAFNQLKQQGLVFPSNLSRSELIEKYDGIYPKALIGNEEEKADSAWRLNFEFKNTILPDFLDVHFQPKTIDLLKSQFPIIRKRDGDFAYQLASVVDDIHFDVTHIVRGEDLYPSSIIQNFIKNQLYPNTSKWYFYHHKLLTINGKKMSKSALLGVKINSQKHKDFLHVLSQCKDIVNISGNNLHELTVSIKLKISDLKSY